MIVRRQLALHAPVSLPCDADARAQRCCDRNPDRSHSRAFTLIELLVVIAIIAILAGLLVPVLAAAIRNARKKVALIEMRNLAVAISAYDGLYSRMPASTSAAQAASPDFTFGTMSNNITLTGGKGQVLPSIGNNNGVGYQAPNSEVIAILLDATAFPDGTPTANANHTYNSQHHVFLSPNFSGDTKSHGVGKDFVYRDPWGNPYIISLDMNGDNKCRDGFYALKAVSSGPNNGGLIAAVPGTDSYEVSATVVIWCLGPDGNANSAFAASLEPNKDNLKTW